MAVFMFSTVWEPKLLDVSIVENRNPVVDALASYT